MFVIDNSVVMRWLFQDGSDEDRTYAAKVAALVELDEVHVPALFVAEAANVIARALKSKIINRQQCAEYFELISAMRAVVGMERDTSAVAETALLAHDQNLSAYDATYLRLAKTLACPIATLDSDLRKAALQSGVMVLNP